MLDAILSLVKIKCLMATDNCSNIVYCFYTIFLFWHIFEIVHSVDFVSTKFKNQNICKIGVCVRAMKIKSIFHGNNNVVESEK